MQGNTKFIRDCLRGRFPREACIDHLRYSARRKPFFLFKALNSSVSHSDTRLNFLRVKRAVEGGARHYRLRDFEGLSTYCVAAAFKIFFGATTGFFRHISALSPLTDSSLRITQTVCQLRVARHADSFFHGCNIILDHGVASPYVNFASTNNFKST